MRILPGVDLDKINKASNVYRKDKRGNRIRWEFITWKNLYWRNSIGHDDDYDSIMQFGNRTHLWGIERSGFFNGREKWAKGFENQRV